MPEAETGGCSACSASGSAAAAEEHRLRLPAQQQVQITGTATRPRPASNAGFSSDISRFPPSRETHGVYRDREGKRPASTGVGPGPAEPALACGLDRAAYTRRRDPPPTPSGINRTLVGGDRGTVCAASGGLISCSSTPPRRRSGVPCSGLGSHGAFWLALPMRRSTKPACGRCLPFWWWPSWRCCCCRPAAGSLPAGPVPLAVVAVVVRPGGCRDSAALAFRGRPPAAPLLGTRSAQERRFEQEAGSC